MKKISIWVWISLTGIALLAGARIYSTTVFGPWVYSDSAAYIASARSLADGNGLGYITQNGEFTWLTLHPPFYSLVIGGLEWLHVPELESLRWLNIVLMTASVFLLGAFLYRSSRSYLVGLGGMLWMLVSPQILDAFSSAMSEPLFIFLEVLGLFLLAQFLEKPRRGLLWSAAAVFGLAFLTRYIGIALILAAGLSILLFSAGGWKRRLSTALGFGAAAVLPGLIWLGWIYSRTQSAAARVLDFSLVREGVLTYLSRIKEVIAEWLPYPHRWTILVDSERLWIPAAMIFLFPIAVWTWNQCRKAQKYSAQTRTGWLLAICSGIYLLVLGDIFVFSRPMPDINQRMLSAIQPLVWAAVYLAAENILRRFKWQGVAVLAVLVLIFFNTRWFNFASKSVIRELSEQGRGYASLEVRQWDLIPELQKLPADVLLASNEPALVLFYANRYPYPLGDELYQPEAANPMEEVCQTTGGMLVLFRTDMSSRTLEDDLYSRRTAGLTPVFEGASGGIYACSISEK